MQPTESPYQKPPRTRQPSITVAVTHEQRDKFKEAVIASYGSNYGHTEHVINYFIDYYIKYGLPEINDPAGIYPVTPELCKGLFELNNSLSNQLRKITKELTALKKHISKDTLKEFRKCYKP
jgi:hypothetical protein